MEPEPEVIPRMAVDVYCITHPKGEEYAREVVQRLVRAGLLKIISSGELNATSNTAKAGQH